MGVVDSPSIVKGLVLKSLTILEDVVLGVAEEATKPKNVLYSSVKKFIELSTNLFQPFLSFSGMYPLLGHIVDLLCINIL